MAMAIIQIVTDGLIVGLASAFLVYDLRPRHNIEIVTFTEVTIQTTVVKFSDDRTCHLPRYWGGSSSDKPNDTKSKAANLGNPIPN